MRNIPQELALHLQQSTTTTCRLLRFVLADGRSFGITSLNRELTYDGTIYSARNGFDLSVIASDVGLSVDNAEAYALLSLDATGITLDMALAGELDNAAWEVRLVNYRDLSMGHLILDAGDVGEVTTENNVIYAPELLSYAMRLRQSIGHVDSRTCRAVFGTPARSQTGCGVDAAALWQSGAVTGIGDEPKRIFADSALLLTPAPVPGRVRFTSGPNSTLNRLYQVEAYSAVTGTIALLEPVPFDITPGDTFDIRPDCDKTPTNCTFYANFINYKGEPLIPVGDGIALMTPGAQMPSTFAGSGVVDP